MKSLVAASTWIRDSAAAAGAARFTTTIDGSWLQGRGAFGGLLAAGIVRAMTEVAVPAGSQRTARTLHMSYCAPAREGALACEVTIERAGALVTTTTARLLQDDKLVTLATATFVAPTSRPSAGAHFTQATMPAAPSFADVEVVPLGVPLMPVCTQHFEYRFCIGVPPYSAAAEARTGGWVRVRQPSPGDARADAPLLAALIDAYPPAMMARLDEPRVTASVNLTIDFLAAPSLVSANAPFLLASHARAGDGGVTDDLRELWSEEGLLLASCRQLVTVL